MTRINAVLEPLGKTSSKRAVLSSAALAIIIILYPLSTGSYFQPDVYRFEERITYHQFFQNRYFFNQLTDNLVICLGLILWSVISFKQYTIKVPVAISIGLLIIVGLAISSFSIMQLLSIASLPLILLTYFVSKRFHDRLLFKDSGIITINYLFVAFMILATFSILISLYDVDVNNPFIDIMTLLSRFAPVLMILLIFSLPIRIVLTSLKSTIPKQVTSRFIIFKSFEVPEFRNTITAPKRALWLAIFIGVSILIVLIPHFSAGLKVVGEDTTVYLRWMQELKLSDGFGDFLQLTFTEIQTGDRPLSLVLLYLIINLFKFDAVLAFEIFLPLLLAPTLVFSIYSLTKEVFGSRLVSMFASFVSAVSFQVLIGIYAGFFANWIALILGYVSLWFAVRFLKTKNSKYLVGFSISMIAILFSHSYTWTIFTSFLIIYLAILWWKKLCPKKNIKILFMVVVIIILFDFVKSITLESTTAVQRNIRAAEATELGLLKFNERWSVLVRTVEVFLGGIFGNVIILLLVIYTTMLFKFKNLAGYFLMLFVSIGIFPLFFGDKIIQSRVLYDIPFQIPAGLALAHIFITKNGTLKAIVLGTSLLAMAIYTMSNLGISPR